MFKKLIYSLTALVFTASLAAFAGMWNTTFPIVNGAAYCGSTVNAVCSYTIPAGPTITGLETVPADTNLGQGAAPQTVQIPVSVLNAGPYQYNAPLTGASITVSQGTRQLILEPAGTIAALTVVFPASTLLLDNQRFGLCSTQIVTTLTLTAGSGTTILNGPTAMLVPVATGAGSCVEWIYRVTNTSWYRVQ